MNSVDELVDELCPLGVEFSPIEEVFEVRNGYTPSKRNSAYWANGTVPWFRMEDLRTNGRVLDDSLQHVHVSAVKRGVLFPADSLIVATSATIGEHALVTVPFLCNQRFTCLTPKPAYAERLDPRFAYYYGFKLSTWCRENTTTSSFQSVDMAGFRKFLFALPPLQVQREVVRLLDAFGRFEADLEEELEAELDARRLQYLHYRDSLCDFGAHDVRWETIGEAGLLFGGLTGKSKADFSDGNARYVTYMNVFSNSAVQMEGTDLVAIGESERQNTLRKGDILFTGSSESHQDCGMTSVVAAEPDEPLHLNSFCIGFRLDDASTLDPEFSKHLFRSASLRQQIVKAANGVTRFNVSKKRLAKTRFPVPSIAEQQRIATILNQFDALMSGLSRELPAELAARRKQYEFYRDQLLTFPAATI